MDSSEPGLNSEYTLTYFFDGHERNCYQSLFFIIIDTTSVKPRSFTLTVVSENLGSINTELQDVQRIMVTNIEEVLQREALSGI